MKKTRVVFISPHLSTGGLPQYLFEKIRSQNDIESFLIEYSQITGGKYVVQRNLLKDYLKENFFSLEDDKTQIFKILEKISPDVIAFEEIPETFVNEEILEKIYVDFREKWKIVESTHSYAANSTMKKFLPDKFIMPCEFSSLAFSSLQIPTEVWEYPVVKKQRERNSVCNVLNLDSTKTHILNVGLFTPGKNQKEFFEIAKAFQDYEDIEFHCVGNFAENFKFYWEPLLDECPSNVKVWGERSDVELFYHACDIFLFTSKLELNPISVKEALSFDIDVLLYDMPSYLHKYDKINRVNYLSEDFDTNVQLLKMLIYESRFLITHILTCPNDEVSRKSINSVVSCIDENVDYFTNVNEISTEMPQENAMHVNGNMNLFPTHYGCFQAFRKAIENFDSEIYDYLIICERDCKIECEKNIFRETIEKAAKIMEKEKIFLFSLGDKSDLEFGVMQSTCKKKLNDDFAFLTDKLIGLQCIIINKRGKKFFVEMFKKYPWHGMDIWFNEIALREKILYGILEKRITTQFDGKSIIDNNIKKFLPCITT